MKFFIPLIALITLLSANTLFADEPDFIQSGDILQSEVFFWEEANKIKHSPVLTPELSSFGDEVFSLCLSDKHVTTAKVNLNWSSHNQYIVKDIEKLVKTIGLERGLGTKVNSINPKLSRNMIVYIYDNSYAVTKVPNSTTQYTTEITGSCQELKDTYYALTSTLENVVSISATDYRGLPLDVIYPKYALQKGVGGNIHAYSPNANNKLVNSCRTRSSKPNNIGYYNGDYSSNCRYHYQANFVPEHGYMYYSENSTSLALPSLIIDRVFTDRYDSEVLKVNIIPQNSLLIKKQAASSIYISGYTDNHRSSHGQKKFCGVNSMKIDVVQVPVSCLPYLD